MTIDTRLAEIRARVDAATDGPWSVYRSERTGTYVTRPDLLGIAREWSLVWQDGDAEFIAASRTDLPALLAAVEAVRALHQPMTPEQARRPSGSGRCFHCRDPYPCRTITALTAALEDQG